MQPLGVTSSIPNSERAETSQNGAGAEAVDGGEKEKERAGWMASFLGTKETSLPEDAKIIEECEREKWCNPDNAPAGDGDKSNSCTMDNKLDGTINGCSCKAPPVGGEGFVAKKATEKKQVTMQDGNKADKDVTTCAKTPICTEEQQKKCGQGTCEPGTGSAYTCACTADEHTEKDNKGCFPKECTPEQKAHCGSEGDCERSSKHPDGFKCGCPNYVLFKAADDVDGQKINGMKCLDNEECEDNADKKRCGVKDASPNECLVTSTAVKCECKGDTKSIKKIDIGRPWKDEDPDECVTEPPPLFGCSQDKCRENGDTLAVCAHMSREKRKFITSPDDMEKHVQHACLCSALFKYDDAKDSCVLDETKVKTNEASCKKLDASLATFGDMKCNCPPHFRGGILAPMETAGQFEEMCWPDKPCEDDESCKAQGDTAAFCSEVKTRPTRTKGDKRSNV
eukprot:Cvel_14638.t1-p1 / transcript=Cvel_14638.t1 / gene=Cvel_14638 / organism=Chromera_velia_CCMP2878 / gene_product=hypothetical protein / transcript_product=hypothetical protein / location=Cvel_scaffold1048:406-15412(-) / protein_length=452 / sequence_SO=supercontig / SO=protein_coding / is_pseudo=false